MGLEDNFSNIEEKDIFEYGKEKKENPEKGLIICGVLLGGIMLFTPAYIVVRDYVIPFFAEYISNAMKYVYF